MCNFLDASLAAWLGVMLFCVSLVAEPSLAAMLPQPIKVKPIRPALAIIFTEHKNIFIKTPSKKFHARISASSFDLIEHIKFQGSCKLASYTGTDPVRLAQDERGLDGMFFALFFERTAAPATYACKIINAFFNNIT